MSVCPSVCQAVSMLKTTFSPTPLVFDLEFEGHAVGMWRLATLPRKVSAICRRLHAAVHSYISDTAVIRIICSVGR